MTRATLAERLSDLYGIALAILAVFIADPAVGELVFRGYFVQDADEVIRAWYGRCALENAHIIPYSHLSMMGWTAVLALGEAIGQVLSLPLGLPGRLVTVTMSWLCLRNAARWIRVVGGTDWHATLAVVLIGSSPAFFLLSLTVYPSIALLGLTVTSFRLWAENKHRSAVAVMGWAPLIRWEGILLVALLGLYVLLKRRWRLLLWLMGPYALYLVVNLFRYGNPWTPLAYRTTKHMGAWLVLNPALTWESIQPALRNLIAFYSPLVLVGGLILVAVLLLRRSWLRRLGPLPLAYAGLTVSLLSIQHESMVWALRVFVTPHVLGLLSVVAISLQFRKTLQRIVLTLAIVGTATSTAMTYQKINTARVPVEGRVRWEPGFHMFVRYADAAPVVDWLHTQKADWIITNHMNANLLRADDQCSLYDLPLRLGSGRMSLSRRFEPAFEYPPGEGLVVFHAAADQIENCELEREFAAVHMRIYRCTGNSNRPSEVKREGGEESP